MRKEELFEVLGELDGDIVEAAGASADGGADRRPGMAGRLRWGAAAACLAVVFGAAAGIFGLKGGPWQDNSVLPPLKVIEYEGAYYERVDMAHTKTLDAYHLPHEITAEMVGEPLGTGLDLYGTQAERTMYAYVPYAGIVTVTAGSDQEQAQRAVYVVEEDGDYAFALFCNPIGPGSNTHMEAREMFAVYGVDEAGDIASISIGRETVSDPARIREIFEVLYNAVSMGNDDFQDIFFKGMSEEDQQALSMELADSMIELNLTTTHGVAINRLHYYPSINYVDWALSYYRLGRPIA